MSAQSTGTFSREEIASWYDSDKGLIDKNIYIDQDIYELELERLFAVLELYVSRDADPQRW